MKFLRSAKLFSLVLTVLIVGNIALLRQNLSSNKSETPDDSGSAKMAQIYQRVQTSAFDQWRARLAHSFQDLSLNTQSLLSSTGVIDESLFVVVTIEPGMRREQVSELLGSELGWTAVESARFARTEPMCYWNSFSLFHVPGTYQFEQGASPEQVEMVLTNQFRRYVASIVKVNKIDNHMLEQALRIASLLQREAAGNGDERIIAGIIWNRLYDGMELQLDATLQYVKGQPGNWWPIVKSADKYIDSPYNTYQNHGLPPGPIASSDLDMIIAALNPEPTECYFYLHADDRSFYCAPDYEEHKKNIERYL